LVQKTVAVIDPRGNLQVAYVISKSCNEGPLCVADSQMCRYK